MAKHRKNKLNPVPAEEEILLPELEGMEEAWQHFIRNHPTVEYTPRELFLNGYWQAMFSFTRAYERRNGHGFPA